LLVDEPGSEIAHFVYGNSRFASTSAVAHIEATAALTRMQKGKRISAGRLETALRELEGLWQALYTHAVTDSLIQAASVAAKDHALRAYDALHLASIIALQEVRPLTLACWDEELRNAARDRKITLVPEQI
jgi:predicted nucleic acid-binding protein